MLSHDHCILGPMSQEDSLQFTKEANKEISLSVWEVFHGVCYHMAPSHIYIYASCVNMLETNTRIEGHCSEVCR